MRKKFNDFRDLESLLSKKEKEEINKQYICSKAKMIAKNSTYGAFTHKETHHKSDAKFDNTRFINFTKLKEFLTTNNVDSWSKQQIEEYANLINCDVTFLRKENDIWVVTMSGDVTIFMKKLPFIIDSVDGSFTWNNCSEKISNLPKEISGDLILKYKDFTKTNDLNDIANISIGGNIDLSHSKGVLDLDFLPNINNNVTLIGCDLSRVGVISSTIINVLDASNNKIKTINPNGLILKKLVVENNYLTSVPDVEFEIITNGNPCNPNDSIEENRMW